MVFHCTWSPFAKRLRNLCRDWEFKRRLSISLLHNQLKNTTLILKLICLLGSPKSGTNSLSSRPKSGILKSSSLSSTKNSNRLPKARSKLRRSPQRNLHSSPKSPRPKSRSTLSKLQHQALKLRQSSISNTTLRERKMRKSISMHWLPGIETMAILWTSKRCCSQSYTNSSAKANRT